MAVESGRASAENIREDISEINEYSLQPAAGTAVKTWKVINTKA